MSLRETKEEIIENIEESLDVLAGGAPASRLGVTYEDAARGLEALACCNLLLDLDVERFHRFLVFAGYARRRFLRRSHAEQSADHHVARSRCDSFFCALAAGDPALAVEIGALSPAAWLPDGEYEEDFAYFRFLHLLLDGAGSDATAPLVGQMEAAQGGPSPRLDVIKAFQAEDADAFELAFAALVDARNARVDADKKLFTGEVTYGPRASVFVEGLALLRLAELRGLGPRRREYPRCPYVARAVSISPQPEDLFDELEQGGP
ncbi:Imm49 family immunity protein [Sorangium sp. So ce448]|uniref:Imm49 family immunity protein n=1 Tax=Sorangium sp. So ce448 TaxID=3133314 RepID=UPI003F63C732